MAIISCPECCKEISDMASRCPNCGRPIMNQNIQKKLNGTKNKKKSEFSTNAIRIRLYLAILSFVCIIAIGYSTATQNTMLIYHFACGLILIFLRKKRIGSIIALPFSILGFISYGITSAKYEDSTNILTIILCLALMFGIIISYLRKDQQEE